ncbi:hypothetical protein HJG43_03265 [Kineosporiaceae bacterium SCSIO 59966]|nr:hypothetical protein HJG43_03265 [Kineosporiaceae bacterium SCSIO 59966]
MQNEEAQKLLAQALRTAGGRDEEFPAFWKKLDAEAKEFLADTLAKSLVAMVGQRAVKRGGNPAAALEEFTRVVANGGMRVPRAGKHAAPDTATEG